MTRLPSAERGQSAVDQTSSLPDRMRHERVDSAVGNRQDTPLLRTTAVNRGLTPSGYVVSSAVRVTARSRGRQLAAAAPVIVEGVGVGVRVGATTGVWS